jgi:RNA polymerase sigma-70 factor, ECF subfamily
VLREGETSQRSRAESRTFSGERAFRLLRTPITVDGDHGSGHGSASIAGGGEDLIPTAAATPDARDLVTRIASGDRAAERELVHAYERGIRVLVRRHTRPGDPIVEDLVQDVLQHLITRLRAGALRDPAALQAYIRQAVVFNTTAEYRKAKRRGEHVTIESADVDQPGADPAEKAQRERVANAVRKVLRELNVPRDRQLLQRFYLEEQSKEEVCSALGIDASHFHRVAFRARERLRELLVDAGIEGE